MKSVLVLVVLVFGTSLGLVMMSSADDELQNFLAITQCRASCLDKFTTSERTEDNCKQGENCLVCWELCRMLTENLLIWGPMCSASEFCVEGCESACDFVETRNEDNAALSSIWLKSVYEPNTDRVILEWIPEQGMESEGSILYSVLLKDSNGKWFQVAQTTSHDAQIKRGFLSRDTSIRVIAVNATHQLSDSETSYLDSYITGESYHNADKDNKLKWKPKLNSIKRTATAIGLLTNISWPVQENSSANVQYEVSWNVIDDSMEITGHLYTASNVAVLTLWPHSMYSVQVNSYEKGTDVHSRSEALIIDTSDPRVVPPPPTPLPVPCKPEPGITLALHSFVFLSVFFLSLTIIVFGLIANSLRESMILKNKIKEMALKVRSLMVDLQKKIKPEKEQPKPQIFHIV